MALPVGLSLGLGEGPVGGANPSIITGEVPLLEGRGWDLVGKVHNPLAPQIEEDIGHLISTLATKL